MSDGNTRGWTLDAARINRLQDESIERLVKRCKQAHFVNVQVRINGEWEEFEADWIKHLVPADNARACLHEWKEIKINNAIHPNDPPQLVSLGVKCIHCGVRPAAETSA